MSEIRNYGIGGANAADILRKEVGPAKEFRPTLTILLGGSNDTCNPKALSTPENFRKTYRKILRELNAIGSRIIVMTIPPVIDRALMSRHGKEPYGMVPPSERIAVANEIVREEAARAGAVLVDLHADFAKTDLDAVNGYLFNRKNGDGTDDGCHPNHHGHSRIAWLLKKAIDEVHADTARVACLGDSITYGHGVSGSGSAAGDCYPGRLNVLLNPETRSAKPISGFVRDCVIYQMSLRAFTREGTLRAAEEHLSEVAATGADVLYLLPIVEADDDPRREFWSERQKRSRCENPRSPYRLMDYYAIDPEYGTKEDLKSFVRSAHALGMKVILDLVYYHAGPTFAVRHPEFVRKNPDGSPRNGLWHFPELDFEHPGLREHLWENMEYFVREFDVDGYRCDVGDSVPLDFWVEGRRRMEKIKADVLLLDEGETRRPEDQEEAFDINYSFSTGGILGLIFSGEYPAVKLRQNWTERKNEALRGARFLRLIENHDIANDVYDKRYEKVWGSDAVEAALVLCFTLDGVPFLYNGIEHRDTARHSIFSHPGEHVLLRNPEAPEGRTAFLRNLASLRKNSEALREGETIWLDHDREDQVLCFLRQSEKETLLVCVNASAAPLTVRIEMPEGVTMSLPESESGGGNPLLLSRGAQLCGEEALELERYGFLVLGIPQPSSHHTLREGTES